MALLLSGLVLGGVAPQEKAKPIQVEGFVHTRLDYTRTGDSDATDLVIRRARATLKGRFFDRRLRYKLAVDFGRAKVSLKDAFVDVGVVGKLLWIRVGHMKRPFSRERLTGVTSLALVDRSLLESRYDTGRDVGVLLHNRGSGLEWALGAFGNIDMDDPTTKPSLVLTARLGWAMKGLDGYLPTDARGGALRAGVSASAVVLLDNTQGRPVGWRWEGDAIAKIHGVTLSASVMGRVNTFERAAHDGFGLYGLAAWRLLPELELAARWANEWASDRSDPGELRGGINTYLFGDHLKLQLDAGWLLPGDGFELRLQVQVQ